MKTRKRNNWFRCFVSAPSILGNILLATGLVFLGCSAVFSAPPGSPSTRDAAPVIQAAVSNTTAQSPAPLGTESQQIAGVEIDSLPLLGPYLLPTQTPSMSIRVAFRGTEDKTITAAGVLNYGLNSPGEQEVTFDAAPSHVIELQGLSPGAEYQYQLRLGDYRSPVYRFRTAPAPGTRASQMKIVAIADFHVHSPQDVAAKIPKAEKFFSAYGQVIGDIRKFKPDFVLLPGDIVHVGGKREQYETFFRLMRDVCANALILPCPGNHERQRDPKLSNYADFFPNPVPVPAPKKPAEVGAWAMAYGGVGFVVSGRRTWLKDALQTLRTEGQADVLIYVRHEPVYLWSNKGLVVAGVSLVPMGQDPEDTNSDGNDVSLSAAPRDGITEILDAAEDVRLCLYGHYHMHQRTFPLLAGQATSSDTTEYGPEVRGTIYMQVPSIWYQYAFARENPLVASNGKPAGGGESTGYSEITITPEKIVVETFGYSQTARHELIDRLTLLRKPLKP